MPKSTHVIGPPGTGKTHWISGQVEQAIDVYGKRKVAVCSLTRAAAAEAVSRIDLDRNQVGTLHSFCYRETCSDADIFETDKNLISEWNENFRGVRAWQMKKPDENEFFQRYGRHKSMLTEPLRADDIHFADAYNDFKQQTGCIDFTDMLLRGLDLETMPGHPYSVFIDEAQDMSRLEAKVLRQWAAHMREIAIVGDPYQNLYEFRGSDAAAMLPKHILEDGAIVLPQSYRIPRAVHELAIKTISRMPDYIPVEYHPKDADGYVKTAPMPDVAMLAAEHADRGESSMILAPAAYQLDGIIKQLRNAGIPYHNPYKHDNGAWNPIRGGGVGDKAKAYLRIRTNDRWTPHELKQWTSAITPSKLWRRGSGAAAKREIDAMLATEDMKDDEIDEWMFRIITNNMVPEAQPHIVDGNIDWFMANAKQTASLSFLENILNAGRIDADPMICVGTIHSVKGGQADHVYVIQDLSPKQYESRNVDAAALARMFYVAVTRAKQGVTIIKPTTDRNYEL